MVTFDADPLNQFSPFYALIFSKADYVPSHFYPHELI